MSILGMVHLQDCEGCNKKASEGGNRSTGRRGFFQGWNRRDIQMPPYCWSSAALPAASSPAAGHSSAAPIMAATTRPSRACSHYSPGLDDEAFPSSVSLLTYHKWNFSWQSFKKNGVLEKQLYIIISPFVQVSHHSMVYTTYSFPSVNIFLLGCMIACNKQLASLPA